MKVLMVTGHRPDKLGGYSDQAFNRLVRVAGPMLRELKPDVVITGMALGWDQAIAVACAQMGLPFHAYVPFEGQESLWPPQSQARYQTILRYAADIKPGGFDGKPINKGHASGLLLKRNEDMVKAADQCLALWDGTPGGTAHAVRECERVGVPVVNCYDLWLRTA